MTILGQPEKYSDVLNRVFWGHVCFAGICVAGLNQTAPWVSSFIQQWQQDVSLDMVGGLKAGAVALPLLVALFARIVVLHDRMSDALRLRERFDVNVILTSLAKGASVHVDAAVMGCFKSSRESLMSKVFYKYASFEGPLIDTQLVRNAADRWAWFWTFFEPIPVVLLTAGAIYFLGDRNWAVGLLLLALAQAVVCFALWPSLTRGGHKQVQAILEDPAHGGAVAKVLLQFRSDCEAALLDAQAQVGDAAGSGAEPGPGPARQAITHIFIAQSSNPSSASVAAAVVCVVVDDIEALDRAWSAMMASMIEAPELQIVAEVRSGLHNGVLRPTTAHPLVRERVASALAELIFEAYAAVTSRGVTSDDDYRVLLSAILADRLRSNRTKRISVKLVDESRLGIARDIVNSVLAESGDSSSAVQIGKEPAVPSVGSLVAEHVSDIVAEHFSGGSGRFARIHPAKLRVLYDAELKRYYTRRDPFVAP